MTTNRLLDAALAYAERGWPVFPCKTDKTPYTQHGVHDATTDKHKIKDMWSEHPNANIGFAVGEADMCVLDGDPGHDMKELEKNVGPIPDTKLVCRTPRGGWHKYLGIGRDEQVAASASKLAPHVDVRSFNSYTLLPPSRTKDGEYTWESQGKPAYRTDAIFEAANKAVVQSEDWDSWSVKPDQAQNIEAATVWLREEAKIAIEGQGGDALAFATAAAMKSYAISPEQAQELMWDVWNPRCSPPWKPSEIDHFNQKILNGYAYNTFPPGNWTMEYKAKRELEKYDFESVTGEHDGVKDSWNRGKFRIVSRAGMAHIQPPEWLVRDFLPEESYAIIFGRPSTCKTFVALDIGLSVATGYVASDTAMWTDLAQAGPVLFAAGEGRASITQRVRAWERTHLHGAPVAKFYLADPVPLISEDKETLDAFFNNALDASPDGYKLVIIDTVGRSMQGVNENAQEHASAFTNLVQAIQKRLGASVLALHHVGHGDTSRARGSSVFGADADTIIKLERQDDKDLLSMEMVKQKDAAEWDQKKWAVVDIFKFNDTDETLVVRKALNEEIPRTGEEGLSEGQRAVLALVKPAIVSFLAGDPNASYPSSAVSRELIGLKNSENELIFTGVSDNAIAKNITKTWLSKVKVLDCQAGRCWVAEDKRWQFAEEVSTILE
jgi:hypothetical protein